MPGPPWDIDPPGSDAALAANARAVVAALFADRGARHQPTLALAADWHRQIYAGVPVPSASYIGEPRDSDPNHPDLIGYEVTVGPHRAVASSDVPRQLQDFIGSLRTTVKTFDGMFPVGQPPASAPELFDVLRLCAVAHGEWIRIHPYANGNGRTARTWANWVAIRYGVPPFLTVKPRPASTLYARAAADSMRGNHLPCAYAFADVLSSLRSP